MAKNVQVNCKSYDCFYNKEGICDRSGIHASKKSCYCFADRNNINQI